MSADRNDLVQEMWRCRRCGKWSHAKKRPSVAHFCSWDCLVKFVATHPPEEIIPPTDARVLHGEDSCKG